ncbi:hypothetical protein SAMN04487895_101718 [Paenibacillus sophorae]|uniref:Uncharacterized protein n=1 Tax=Paenibacillus sophorae TaxID=1333845 RepID=A0A1H8H1Q7_9BACL|nr:hypothetical protein [Paenibacillus sophorae]QWU14408.1 hypothetical protein KP014_21100 [Paenibacillus sophorae]SEN49894.1 hypothetical protein SAMN04487895_101718 [Paenibacillus sophorae]
MSNLNINEHNNDYNHALSSNNNITVEEIAAEHKEGLNKDNAYKVSVIASAISNTARYAEINASSLEDFTGIAEAYKAGAIESEEEMQNQFKIFMEEYAVNLINLLNQESGKTDI